MRDRLIELINDMQDKGFVSAKGEDEISCHVSNKNIADYLLENGVIVPPCDTVWFIVDKGTEYAMAMPRKTDELPLYMFKDLNKYGY